MWTSSLTNHIARWVCRTFHQPDWERIRAGYKICPHCHREWSNARGNRR